MILNIIYIIIYKMKVTALTYNISWANQKNIIAGSERDFVQMCQDVQI